MANYPNSIPSIPTLTGSDFPKAEHLNAPNREIEAICMELGTDPRNISPISPIAEPQNVAHYLDMIAGIIKAIHGGANWYSVGPARQMVGGTLLGATVAAGTTVYTAPFTTITSATQNSVRLALSNNLRVIEWRVRTHSAQPGTGSLVFDLMNNTTSVSTITVAAGSAANTFASGAVSLNFASGSETMSIRIVNNAAGASAQIGMHVEEIHQVG